ncbi:type IVB secretion system protein IcmH/DotU [Candidatus Eisenbacteria bacterium]|uniref:Type IVB secretion system protein IcmH/DotU n=1 Tax=Eiseniibacteriota bacterium TaxID=2212470 RepID=A0ABV6YMF2_UNCEI
MKTAAQGRLTRSAGSLLSLLIILRRSRDLDSFSDLKRTIERLFHDFRSQARDEGVSAEQIEDASYALAASFDEALLSASWEGKEAWQKDNLAKVYCNDEFVGDGFYDKLAEVRRSIEPKREVVEIFYYCLISGFQGRLIESPQKRDDLIDDLSHDIGTKVKVLSPKGLPEPEGGRLQPIRRFPWPLVALVCILVPLLVWLVSWEILDRHAETIVRTLGGN